METSEMIILISIVIAAFIFLTVAYQFSLAETKNTKKLSIEKSGKDLIDIIEKISNSPSEFAEYRIYTPMVNISVNNGILIYEKNNFNFSYIVPINIDNVKIEDAGEVCIVKENKRIKLLEKCPKCNLNGRCELTECYSNCPDCYGPNSICIGDNYCNKDIGENCKNSIDCRCSGACCPSDPSSDSKGCVHKQNLKKGEECYCDSECSKNLYCNPVAPNFKKYKKACCPKGKFWNGTACIKIYCSYPCFPECRLPDEWDWSHQVLPNAPPHDHKNWMNPIRNQGNCGACWAFSTVGAVENTYNVEYNCPSCNKDLSEQQLISCCNSCGNCNGGYPWEALRYIKNNGIVDEKCFPYKASNSKCSPCSDYKKRLWKIKDFKWVGYGENEKEKIKEIKRALICNGPLSVSILPWPGTVYGHAVVLVGYSDKLKKCDIGNGNGCWIIRNSWGPSWDHNGYGTISYGLNHIEDYVYSVNRVIPP